MNVFDKIIILMMNVKCVKIPAIYVCEILKTIYYIQSEKYCHDLNFDRIKISTNCNFFRRLMGIF